MDKDCGHIQGTAGSDEDFNADSATGLSQEPSLQIFATLDGVINVVDRDSSGKPRNSRSIVVDAPVDRIYMLSTGKFASQCGDLEAE